MKKTTLLFILFLTGLMDCSAPVTPGATPQRQNNAAPAFQLIPTTNMWTVIKLDTRYGRMLQVQYDIQGEDRMEVVLNENYLAGNDCAGNGRFTLYSTKNMYTFILLDQHDGRMWQVQWAIDVYHRLVIPINPTQNSTNL